LPVILHGCKTSSLTLRVDHRRAEENMLTTERDDVTEGCRKVNNEKLYNLYSLQRITKMIKSRSMRWEGHVARMHISYWWKAIRKQTIRLTKAWVADSIKMILER
jgi:hypothetical protein